MPSRIGLGRPEPVAVVRRPHDPVVLGGADVEVEQPVLLVRRGDGDAEQPGLALRRGLVDGADLGHARRRVTAQHPPGVALGDDRGAVGQEVQAPRRLEAGGDGVDHLRRGPRRSSARSTEDGSRGGAVGSSVGAGGGRAVAVVLGRAGGQRQGERERQRGEPHARDVASAGTAGPRASADPVEELEQQLVHLVGLLHLRGSGCRAARRTSRRSIRAAALAMSRAPARTS